MGILGRGKRGPGTGPLLREERGERTWGASGASDAASLRLAARQAGHLPPCRHGDPGPLSRQTPCPPALRPESALASPRERRQGGSRREERTGSPGAWGGGCRIPRERGAAPHTPPGDRPYPLCLLASPGFWQGWARGNWLPLVRVGDPVLTETAGVINCLVSSGYRAKADSSSGMRCGAGWAGGC